MNVKLKLKDKIFLGEEMVVLKKACCFEKEEDKMSQLLTWREIKGPTHYP